MRTWCAITFGYDCRPMTEWFETEEEAIKSLRETAETYLDAGERIPLLDEWGIVRLTHTARQSMGTIICESVEVSHVSR